MMFKKCCTAIMTVMQLSFISVRACVSRANASASASQSQGQNLRENVGKLTTERDNLKKELEAKTQDIQEKIKTITQVKKIGRRYKTQYEELKALHDKVH